MLLRELAEVRPGDAVLSEESADSPERLSAKRVWIIDPLDGTREYGMPGRDDWAVHVALWEAGAGITAAAVAQPALNTVYVSDQVRVKHRPRPRPRFLVSDSRPPEWAAPVAQALGAQLVPMGSAGAKAMAVVRGEADAYLHGGGQWEWDSAAPVGVATAAGLCASRIDGSPLSYNNEHPYLPDLLICRYELVDDLLREIAAATAAS
jgi:3'(2'), 5'-bisphosphate nucleotidase